MNQYWIIALLALLGATGFFGYRYGVASIEVKCLGQQEAQQQHVIGQMQTQNQITQGVQNAYHTGIAAIDTLYATARVQPSVNGAMRLLPATTGGTETSKRYQLTPRQCDQEEAKCSALWSWARQQSAIK